MDNDVITFIIFLTYIAMLWKKKGKAPLIRKGEVCREQKSIWKTVEINEIERRLKVCGWAANRAHVWIWTTKCNLQAWDRIRCCAIHPEGRSIAESRIHSFVKGGGRQNAPQKDSSHYLIIKHTKWLMFVFTSFGLSY